MTTVLPFPAKNGNIFSVFFCIDATLWSPPLSTLDRGRPNQTHFTQSELVKVP
jgi:hypothetical protein